jgi:hypothetical protein
MRWAELSRDSGLAAAASLRCQKGGLLGSFRKLIESRPSGRTKAIDQDTVVPARGEDMNAGETAQTCRGRAIGPGRVAFLMEVTDRRSAPTGECSDEFQLRRGEEVRRRHPGILLPRTR